MIDLDFIVIWGLKCLTKNLPENNQEINLILKWMNCIKVNHSIGIYMNKFLSIMVNMKVDIKNISEEINMKCTREKWLKIVYYTNKSCRGWWKSINYRSKACKIPKWKDWDLSDCFKYFFTKNIKFIIFQNSLIWLISINSIWLLYLKKLTNHDFIKVYLNYFYQIIPLKLEAMEVKQINTNDYQ